MQIVSVLGLGLLSGLWIVSRCGSWVTRVLFISSENYTVNYDYFTRWKIMHGLFGGPLRLGGPGPGPSGPIG